MTLTKECVVTHKNFGSIINAAIERFGYIIEPLNIELEDFHQEVAAHILRSGIDPNSKLSTNIYVHVRWTMGELKKKKRPQAAQMLGDPISNSPTKEVENNDLLGIMMQYTKPREAHVLNQVIGLNIQQVDMAQELGVSKQRVNQILESGLKRIRANYCKV